MLGPNETSYTYNEKCPYNSDLTLCPYSQYCFSIASFFAFRGTPIGASVAITKCTDTNEACEFN